MLNPVKVQDNLWSIGLASMFNWSSVSVRQRGTGGSGCDGDSDAIPRLTTDSGEPSSPNFEGPSLYHFPFPTNLLSRNLQEKTCSSIKQKLMKQAGGKSFTIDSLLGITNAAQVAIQNCMLPGQQCTSESKWIHDKVQYDHGKDSRFSPYHTNLRKDRTTINLGNASMITSEKSGEKVQKSRRAAKSKRVRTIFTPEQLERLEAEFERQQYMVGPERLYLASSLYLTEAQVKVWFQNRRIKWRKQHLEMQQQRLAVFRSKQSSLGNEDGEDYEEDSDGSTSVTMPPSEPHGSLNNLPLVTTFSGSLFQESLNCTNKEVLPENNSTTPLSFSNSRRTLTPQDSSL